MTITPNIATPNIATSTGPAPTSRVPAIDTPTLLAGLATQQRRMPGTWTQQEK